MNIAFDYTMTPEKSHLYNGRFYVDLNDPSGVAQELPITKLFRIRIHRGKYESFFSLGLIPTVHGKNLTASFQIALRNFGSWSFLNATTSSFPERFCSVRGMNQNFSVFEISLDLLVLLY